MSSFWFEAVAVSSFSTDATTLDLITAYSALGATTIILISALIGVPAYFANMRREKVQRTWQILDQVQDRNLMDITRFVHLKCVNELCDKVGPLTVEITEAQNSSVVELFNTYERIALGIRRSFYDYKTFEDYWGAALLRDWALFVAWADRRRTVMNYDDFLCDTEWLQGRLIDKVNFTPPPYRGVLVCVENEGRK